MLKSRERAVSPATMIVDIQNNMRYESLGNTGLLVSRLCLGTMTFGDGQGPFKAIGTVGQKEADALVKAAIEEDVDGIGVSYLSGQHMTQMRRLLDALREQNCHVPIFCGGVIPADDATELRALGVAAVVPPGTLTDGLLRIVAGVLSDTPATTARATSLPAGS